MITRPMHGPSPLQFSHDGGDAALHPLRYQSATGTNGGYPGPVVRTKSFGFRPRILPPVNLVRGGPRLY